VNAAHPDDERLILFHYEGDRAVARHLAGCLPCRGRIAGIEKLLKLVETEPVPERGEAYGRDVWRRIAARLPERREPAWRLVFAPPRLAFAGALAGVALAAFLTGRFWRSEPPAAATASQTRERILLVTVGDHLERSQTVLIELLHAPAEGPAAEREKSRARELLADNRLYRQTAASAGERGVSDVLEDLERVLLEASHGASPVSMESLEGLRRRAEAEGVLFKIRVLGSRVREREEAMAPRNERKRT
jgi:hypothetical protein